MVASGSSQSYTATLNTGTLGTQTQTFSLNVGRRPYATGGVRADEPFDHRNPDRPRPLQRLVSSDRNQTTQTINFGNVLRGATVPSQSFTIYNLAANTSAAYTANLKLTGFTASGDAALTTTSRPSADLPAGSGNTFTASLNTGNYTTTGIKTVTMSASQLADDSSLPGAGSNNNGAITVTLQGNVGNATADASNSADLLRQPLDRPGGPGRQLRQPGIHRNGDLGQRRAGHGRQHGHDPGRDGKVPTTVSMAWRTAAPIRKLASRALSAMSSI